MEDGYEYGHKWLSQWRHLTSNSRLARHPIDTPPLMIPHTCTYLSIWNIKKFTNKYDPVYDLVSYCMSNPLTRKSKYLNSIKFFHLNMSFGVQWAHSDKDKSIGSLRILLSFKLPIRCHYFHCSHKLWIHWTN